MLPQAQVLGQQKISSTAGQFPGPLSAFDRFGISMDALGDVDGDGIGDVVVGAHHDNDGGFNHGAIWLLLLKRDGTVRAQRKISDLSGGFSGVLDDEDRFGISVVCIGDLDQDGVMDLAVGGYRDDDAGLDAGAVWILFLKPDGSVREHTKINGMSGPLAGRLGPNHLFGRSLAAMGDFDGDGYLDLLVGSSRAPGGGFQRGVVWLLRLHADGSVRGARRLGSGLSGFDGGPSDDDRFGAAVACLGDLDGNGVKDIAVSGYRNDQGGQGQNADRGALWILFLKADGSVLRNQKIAQGVGGFGGTLRDNDEFGIAMCAPGDLNADGVPDLVVGAEGDDDGGENRGAIYTLFLNADGSVSRTNKISSNMGNLGPGLSDGDNFGISIASPGDLDGDGVRDLLIGASRDDDGASNAGSVWGLFLDGLPVLAPVAEFSNVVRFGSRPLRVRFVDESLGEVDSWQWDFGDGTFSSHQNPVHTFLTSGRFNVRLTVGGPGGVQRILKPNQVTVSRHWLGRSP